MPRLQDLYFDSSIDDDYSDEGGGEEDSSNVSSSTSTDLNCNPKLDEEPASETDEDIPFISRPTRRTIARERRQNQSEPWPLNKEISFVEQEVMLVKALKDLESPEEMKNSYPHRFTTPSFEASQQYTSESTLLDQFISLEAQHTDPQNPDQDSELGSVFFEFELDDFCVYKSAEMCLGAKERWGLEGRYESLHIVSTNLENPEWYVDGVLKHKDNTTPFIRGNIVDVCIGALEDTDYSSATNYLWIQTNESQKKDYWYRLKKPIRSYEQYWSKFVWLANFAKYFIDFLCINHASGVNVCLAAFESDFWNWLEKLHGPAILAWHAQCGKRKDFRQHVLNHSGFLRNQVYSLQKDSSNPRFSHKVWDEVAAGDLSHDRQAISKKEKTVVTQHVAYSFNKTFPHWHKEHRLFDVVEKCAEVEAYGKDRRRKWNFPNKLRFAQTLNFRGTGREKTSKAEWLLEEAATENRPVRVRDPGELLNAVVVVRVPLNEWDQYDFRYAWVRVVSQSTISVVWLALPKHTLCETSEKMSFYPIGNELFFTDECNCKPIRLGNVLKIIKASAFTDQTREGCELFIHSLYRQNEEVHVNAIESELSCGCQRPRKASQNAVNKKSSSIRTSPLPKMKVCALCSGCGLLDHAFCAAGFAETIMAVEHNEAAARSHRANNPVKHCEYFIDSVNPVFRRYITGKEPLPDGIDCFIAGCPCQGWSCLNQMKGSHDYKSQKNCSILANMLSWIEVLMPTYVLLENVPNMDRTRPSACAQAICLLVALGYQVRKSIRADGEVGGASTRRRLFIVAAAPGAVLPDHIPISRQRKGSELRNFRTAWSAISNLPLIENDTTLNHSDPEHIPIQRLKINWQKDVNFRRLVQKIRTSLSNAYEAGQLSERERKFFRGLHDAQRDRNSKCYKRIVHDEPFRTIATTINLMDARLGGETIHPFQNRVLSLREIFRAMGVPDWFLLAGNIAQKHHQLGNGVPWALGKGWGEQFGQAWEDTCKGRGRWTKPTSVAEESRVENVLVETSVTTSTTTEDNFFRGKRKSTSETLYTTTKTVIRTRRLRRVVVSDDSDTDVPTEATPDSLRSTPGRLIRASSQTKPPTPKLATVVDLTGDSDSGNEPPSDALKTPTSISTSEATTKEALGRGEDEVRAASKQRPNFTPKKRRAPEGPDDLDVNDEEFQPLKKRPVPVVEIPKMRTKQ